MSERAWHNSIYWRIAIGFVLLMAIVLVVQGVIFLWIVARADGALPAHALLDVAHVIAFDLDDELERNGQLDVATYMRDHYGQVERRVSVLMADGRTYANYPFAVPRSVIQRSRQWIAEGAPAQVEAPPVRFGRSIAFAKLRVHRRDAGIVAVQPGQPTSRVLGEILPAMLLGAAGVMVGGTILGAIMIFRPGRRRLTGLEEAARQLGAGQVDARAPVTGSDEITAVARAFNRMAEDLATRAELLKASDSARRQLLADVSHELMTPLTAIRGYVETLAMPDLTLDEATRRRYLGVIEQETLRLETIVGDLLDLARLSAGGGALRVQDIAVKDLFERVTARHERQANDKEVILGVEIQPGAERLSGDPDRLEQALQNLAANALRHTPVGGRVDLRALRGDGAVILQVRDTGEGIPAEHLPLIFDRFYKVDGARSGTTAGSGLGLSIVRAIVERHSGTVIVTSNPGVETVFEIRLPLNG